MPAPPLDRPHLDAFRARLSELRADSPRQWGGLTATKMLAHLSAVIEMSLGERDTGPPWGAAPVRVVLRWLFVDLFPYWPRGKVKAPDAFTPEPEGTFEEERRRLEGLMARFCEERERHPERRRPSPGFGNMNMKKWARLHGIHADHHFTQFGV